MIIPTATYRIQFNPHFTFRNLKEISAYLQSLGISDIYASPVFKARKGSMHGYDIVDPGHINPELGTLEELRELITSLKSAGIGWIQDIVPNHMAIDSDNIFLTDIFENGSNSPYFTFFDIDWAHPYENMKGRILIPLLGKFYAETLESGELKLIYENKGFYIAYYDLKFPIRIDSYPRVLEFDIPALEGRLGESHNGELIQYLGMAGLFKTAASNIQHTDYRQQVEHAKNMLWGLYTEKPVLKEFIDANIRSFNGRKDEPRSFDMLDELISEQRFRLSFWKVATEEINYRRFFTVNDLISVRVEDKDVFDHTHRLIFQLISEGLFDGLRIDHIDGLYNPTEYLQRIREKVQDAYIVAEKILEYDESLPMIWKIQGTTGYDFLNFVNAIFCDVRNSKEFGRIYYRFTKSSSSYEDILYRTKQLIIGKHMAGNIENLGQYIKLISSKNRFGRDITLYALKRALVEVMTLFPVYRTYINSETISTRDSSYIKKAIKKAQEKSPGLWYELNFIEKFLLLNNGAGANEQDKKGLLDFIMNFQQQTGSVMAKGLEDTFLYVYNRLISLNEVGGLPARFGCPLSEFHNFNLSRGRLHPYSINATSTHDTKRGEDVRTRIDVLSEMPQDWNLMLRLWRRSNRTKKTKLRSKVIPDENDEYFLYQTLIGACPFEGVNAEFKERIKSYIIKAVREAKVHTAWIKPDTDYEQAYLDFLDRLLILEEKNDFLSSFIPFQKKIAYYGIFNSLSQTLIKITAPGVSDFYQGAELWDLNLVDPDNRRPVDFSRRMSFLKDIKQKSGHDRAGLIKELLSEKENGKIKLFTIYRALQAKGQRRDVFEKGEYIPLESTGAYADNIIAFARRLQRRWSVTIAPRLLASVVKENECPLRDIWLDTSVILPEDAPLRWQDYITDNRIEGTQSMQIRHILTHFPAALLIGEKE